MLVSDLLNEKGDLVVTIHPDVTLGQATKQLSRFNFGVLVASEDGKVVSGIISERDVVRRIAEVGAKALDIPVRSVMTRDVHVCRAADTTDSLMQLMTKQRIRHLPVVRETPNGDHVCGIISITDLVQHRVQELEQAT